MKIGITGIGLADSSSKIIQKDLDDEGISSITLNQKSKPSHFDCIIVLGGDRGVRNYFHHASDLRTPVFGINESESNGFLAQIDLKEFPTYIKRLKKGNYTVEKVPRLGVKIDGKNEFPVLNDVLKYLYLLLPLLLQNYLN